MYIDPNTGGMLFQVLASLLAVFSGIALLFSGKIRAAIGRLRRSVGKDGEQTTIEEEDNSSEVLDE